MTELEKIIRSRKSTYPKDFSQGELSREELNKILSVTAYAPHHKRTYPWRFKVYTGDAKSNLKDELGVLYKRHTADDKFDSNKLTSIQVKVEQSAAVVAIIHHISHKVPIWEETAAIAIAVQNMWLKVSEMKVGGYWSTLSLITHLNEFLKLKENEKCIGLFYLGRVKDKNLIKDHDWQDYVDFIS